MESRVFQLDLEPLAGSAPIPVSILTATASTVSLLSLNNVERETARKTLVRKPRV